MHTQFAIYCTHYVVCAHAFLIRYRWDFRKFSIVEMAKKFDSSSHEPVDIGDKAHQPKLLVFPKQKCGIKD